MQPVAIGTGSPIATGCEISKLDKEIQNVEESIYDITPISISIVLLKKEDEQNEFVMFGFLDLFKGLWKLQSRFSNIITKRYSV